MTQEKSTQINTSKREGNIVSDWLHDCCTLDNGAVFFPHSNQKAAEKPGLPQGEKGKSTGSGLWVPTAAMPRLLPVHHSPLPC